MMELEKEKEPKKLKEWTIMFYFASDNPLATSIVSQLKAIKNAGYIPEVNVVAYFDPQPTGTPSHIFDVNSNYKMEDPGKTKIGFASNDPFVRSLMDDRLWRDEKSRGGEKIRDLIIKQLAKKGITYDRPEAPPPPSETSARPSTGDPAEEEPAEEISIETVGPGPEASLQTFLDFCVESYKAKHYMLFILGHGLVVGDDVFLYDEHAAEHSVTLRELGAKLLKFKDDIKDFGKFELVSFHSCSMSSLEVAFELQDTANYMLASQGPAFVGSWPYREILIRVFNAVKKGRKKPPESIEEMVKKIFDSVYYNSTDYLMAGYSFDLCLCDLSEHRITAAANPLQKLAEELVKGLKDVDNPLVNYCILLAHWRSQSYWQENYTDIYDFCLCLADYCEKFINAVEVKDPYQKIKDACDKVTYVLAQPYSEGDNPIIRSSFAGPDSQYSEGLSIFFPWTRPTSDSAIMKKDKDEEDGEEKTEYELYKFNKTGWFGFLEQYWGQQKPDELIDTERSTLRGPRQEEERGFGAAEVLSEEDKLSEDMASLMFNSEGPLNNITALSSLLKVNPPDRTGDECKCGSIKNYLRDTRKRDRRGQKANVKPVFPSKQKLTSI